MRQVWSSTSFMSTRPTSGAPSRRSGDAEAADLDGFETGGFDDTGGQSVVAAGHDQGLAALEFFAKNGGTVRLHDTSILSIFEDLFI